MGLTLQVAPGTTLSAVSYEITGPQGFTAPGATTLTYFATDAAGNDEAPRALIVNVPAAP